MTVTAPTPDDDPRFAALLAFVVEEWDGLDADTDRLTVAAKAFRTAYATGYTSALRSDARAA